MIKLRFIETFGAKEAELSAMPEPVSLPWQFSTEKHIA